jgi:hypothetical protein
MILLHQSQPQNMTKIYYDYTNIKPEDFVTHVYQSLTKKKIKK